MQKIIPHLWFDKDAVEAAKFYSHAIPGSRVTGQYVLKDTPSGDVDVVFLSLGGYQIQLLGAGREFRVNPSLSFVLYAETVAEVDALYAALKEGGSELMPLDSYPFSERYVWLQDKYDVSWQILFRPDRPQGVRIAPAQMFVGPNAGKAAEAIAFYTGLFGGETLGVSRYGAGWEPNEPGFINHATFRLQGQTFAIMDSAYPHEFAFGEAMSYIVNCDSQAEIDQYWNALSADPGAEMCGWCKDKYGFSWQIIPHDLETLMTDPAKAPRITAAFMKMKKLDWDVLHAAAEGR